MTKTDYIFNDVKGNRVSIYADHCYAGETADVELYINGDLAAEFEDTDDADPILEALTDAGIAFADYKDALFCALMVQQNVLDREATAAELRKQVEYMGYRDAMDRVLLHFNPAIKIQVGSVREYVRELDEDGYETIESIRGHIAAVFGYDPERIVLLEGSFRRGICESIAFSFDGLGFETDFRTLAVATQYDC